MPKQQSYPIRGTVTLDGTAHRGAKIWAIDITQTGFTGSVEKIHFARTNSKGQYALNVANIIGSGSYATSDIIRIWCKVGEIITWSDLVLSTKVQQATVNFTITRTSGLTDGLKDTKDSDGKYGFNNVRGLKPGLKDALS